MKVSFKRVMLAASVCLAFSSASAAVMTDTQAVQFLNHATYGATPDDISKLKNIGMNAWIDKQVRMRQCTHYDEKTQTFSKIGERMQFRDEIWWTSSMVCDDQLRQRVALALSEIFVISDANSGTLRRHQDGMEHYYDTLGTYGFYYFNQLLKAVSLNPSMGSYLNMRGNEKANTGNNVRPDENYARELMQLFTIGLVQLNLDGTPKLDDNGKTIPTYSQQDVSELARMLTGWTWNGIDSQDKWEKLKGKIHPDAGQDFINPMVAVEYYHDKGEKTFLGKKIPAGQTAEQDLDRALTVLFNHPNTAPFISKQLIQRLVKSNPSPAYIKRVAQVFNNDGNWGHGNMVAVIKAILTDGEALTENNKAGKLTEPMLRVTQLWRAFSATADDTTGHGYPYIMNGADANLGQSPLSAPSVFNFFEPAYAPKALKEQGLVAPEFQLLDESLLAHLNNRLAAMALKGYDDSGIDPTGFSGRLDYSQYATLVGSPNILLNKLDTLLMGGRMDANMHDTLLSMMVELKNQKAPSLRIVAEIVHMIIISPQYAIQ